MQSAGGEGSRQPARQGNGTFPRDAGTSKERILEAAQKDFSENGLNGARVDRIAEMARINKRMIYHYFGNKRKLFEAVIERAYLAIREAEKGLHLEHESPPAALEHLVRFTWSYYLDNMDFIALVNSENLHQGQHLAQSAVVPLASRHLVDMVSDILDRGVEQGLFRPGIDPVQLNITIAAIGYYYLTNRYTGRIIYGEDFMTGEALDRRLQFNIDTILRLVMRTDDGGGGA